MLRAIDADNTKNKLAELPACVRMLSDYRRTLDRTDTQQGGLFGGCTN